MSTGSFCEHFFFKIQNHSQIYLWILSLEFPNSETLAIFFVRLIKTAFFVFGGIFWGSKFLLQVVFLHACFRNLGQKISELRLTFDRKGRQRSILYAGMSVAMKIVFFEKNRYLQNWFRSLTGSFLNIWRQSLAGLSKVDITHADIIWAKTTVFIKPILLNFSRTLMRIFLGNFGEIFGGVVKFPTYVSANFS